MPRITQRDLAESISGLRSVAKDLRNATESTPSEHVKVPAVLVQVRGLLQHAAYLDQVADELLSLIPDQQVKVPKD